MFDLALVAALSDAGLRRSEASSLTCRIVQVGALGKFSPGVRYAFEVYQVAATAEGVTASGS